MSGGTNKFHFVVFVSVRPIFWFQSSKQVTELVSRIC